MGLLVMYTDLVHSDAGIEREELAKIGAELKVAQCRTEEEVAEACRDADGLLVTYCPVGRRAFPHLSRCRAVVRTGVGYDCVDLSAATEHRIMVCNVPDYCIEEVADHTLALILSWSRRIGELDAQVRRAGWGQPLKPVYRLAGRTLGILGLGRMGRAVAARAKGFGLTLRGYDPYLSQEAFAAAGVEPVSLDVLFRSADILTLHSPLSSETRGIIRMETLRQMKPTALLVNTSRGGLVVTDDLVRALQEGCIAGAALDVLEVEPLPLDHPIRTLPRVLLTPHAAWFSEQAEPELRRRSAQILAQALQGERPASLLNPEALGR